MKEENRKYGQLAYDLVKDAENFGSRLPGSEGERKYADFMGNLKQEFSKNPPKTSQKQIFGKFNFLGKWLKCLILLYLSNVSVFSQKHYL